MRGGDPGAGGARDRPGAGEGLGHPGAGEGLGHPGEAEGRGDPGAGSAKPAVLERLEAAHYQIICALYACETTPTEHGLWVGSTVIPDPEWNHLGRLGAGAEAGDRETPPAGPSASAAEAPARGPAEGAAKDPSQRAPAHAIDGLVEAVAPLAAAAGRRPTLAVTPLSEPPGLVGALTRRGWSVSYRHAWLMYPTERPVPQSGPAAGWDTTPAQHTPPAAHTTPAQHTPSAEHTTLAQHTPPTAPPPGVIIRQAGRPDDIQAFLDVFTAVFTADDPASAAAYRSALEASFAYEGGARVTHYLAFCDGEPAGIASVGYARGVAGGFNLGVLPAHRGRGIGGALTMTRLADARRAGCELVYLLTEDPAVEASQVRRGHVKVMTTEGWSAPEAAV